MGWGGGYSGGPVASGNVPARAFCSTLHGDGEVAGAAVPRRVGSDVLDQRLADWEPGAWGVEAGDVEATS